MATSEAGPPQVVSSLVLLGIRSAVGIGVSLASGARSLVPLGLGLVVSAFLLVTDLLYRIVHAVEHLAYGE